MPSGQPGVGAGLPVRQDRRSQEAEAVEHRRRAHREALAMRVRRTCDADQVVAVIEELVAERGNPEHLRMDGPELIAGRCTTGADWPAQPRPTSSRARRGRTLSSSPPRTRPRRAAQRRGVRHALRGPGPHRAVARRVQHLPTPLRPRRPHPAEYTERWTVNQLPLSCRMDHSTGSPQRCGPAVSIRGSTSSTRGR